MPNAKNNAPTPAPGTSKAPVATTTTTKPVTRKKAASTATAKTKPVPAQPGQKAPATLPTPKVTKERVQTRLPEFKAGKPVEGQFFIFQEARIATPRTKAGVYPEFIGEVVMLKADSFTAKVLRKGQYIDAREVQLEGLKLIPLNRDQAYRLSLDPTVFNRAGIDTKKTK
jgi:hypothetical protein